MAVFSGVLLLFRYIALVEQPLYWQFANREGDWHAHFDSLRHHHIGCSRTWRLLCPPPAGGSNATTQVSERADSPFRSSHSLGRIIRPRLLLVRQLWHPSEGPSALHVPRAHALWPWHHGARHRWTYSLNTTLWPGIVRKLTKQCVEGARPSTLPAELGRLRHWKRHPAGI